MLNKLLREHHIVSGCSTGFRCLLLTSTLASALAPAITATYALFFLGFEPFLSHFKLNFPLLGNFFVVKLNVFEYLDSGLLGHQHFLEPKLIHLVELSHTRDFAVVEHVQVVN